MISEAIVRGLPLQWGRVRMNAESPQLNVTQNGNS